MPIHLYLAPAGAGKTAYAVDIVCDAARALRSSPRVCVPNPRQVQAWRARLAQAGGAFGVRVSTFDALYRDCLADQVYPLLDEPVQYRLIRALIDELPLGHFGPLKGRPGFVQVLQGLIAELKAARIAPAAFRRAVGGLGEGPRLTDLADLYAAYQDRLQAHDWVDHAGLAWLAVDALEQAATPLPGEWPLLVIDGFDHFTPIQLDLLRALSARVAWTLITLTGVTPERTPAHSRFNRTRARLEAALGIRAEPLPAPHATCHAPTLAHLEANLFVHGVQPVRSGDFSRSGGGATEVATTNEPTPAVELLAAADRAAEVRAALRWLKARIVLDGAPPHETALLARNVAPYREFVLQTAAEFGLPIHLVGGVPLRSNPAVAALLDLLGLILPSAASAVGPGLPWRRVVESWRSPYFDWAAAYPSMEAAGPIGITVADAGALDALARRARVVGGLSQWEEALRLAAPHADAEDGEAQDLDFGSLEDFRSLEVGSLSVKFHRFVERITPPAGERSYREFVAWVEELIGADPAPEPGHFAEPEALTSLRLVARARAATPDVAERDAAALVALKDVLRGLVAAEEALEPETRPDFARFYAELTDVVQSTSYSLPEDAHRREIWVADVTQVRGLPLRAVAILGLGEGEFPAPRGEDPFLRDSDRARLRALGLALDPSTESAEAEHFYEAVTRPRERLLLVRSRLADNGASWQPSPYWEEVERLAGVEPQTATGDAVPPPHLAASWPELMESWASEPDHGQSHPGSGTATDRPDLAAEATRRWAGVAAAGAWFRARSADPKDRCDGDLSECAAELARAYGPDHVWSPTRLESYRSCPFQFFIGYVLRVAPRAEPVEGLDASQLGNIYHHILEALYKTASDPSDVEQLLTALPAVVETVLDAAPNREGFRATAWWAQTRREIAKRAERSVRALADIGPEFVPRRFELAFGQRGASPLVLHDGADAVRVHGAIDRLDVSADGRLRVIDYKTGGKTPFSNRAVGEGKKLQLPLYALAVRDALGLGEPVEGFYWHIQQAEPSPFTLSRFCDPACGARGPAAAFACAVRAVFEAARGVRAGQFAPHPPDLGCPSYCAAAAFCWDYHPGFGG